MATANPPDRAVARRGRNGDKSAMTDALPIDEVLPDLLAALGAARRAVLAAPPGAGKTTRVPPALLASGAVKGRIVMLEPRRLAARAAAERMAQTLSEPVGRTVGFRIRGEARLSAATRIEVVTEGILTRMIQSDPGLSGIGAVIFDEFHERSLNADLGLALVWDAQRALREDLLLLVMSATLDTGAVSDLLDHAPVIRSEGRGFPIETRWLARPAPPDRPFGAAASSLVRTALEETQGNMLVFLPGEREIRNLLDDLTGTVPDGCDIRALFGALDFRAQRAALAPAAEGRRNVVLATAIAETSLTLPDIRVVVDTGRARRARFDPASGMTRLVTERVTKAEAEQRRGRAGRTAPGICYRMWARAEDGGLAAFPPPEIALADLTGLALELAMWGTDGSDLAFLTPLPTPALTEARALLSDLGALDDAGRITAHGRQLAALPVHPRIAHMLVRAGPRAATLAALLEDRDPLRGGQADLDLRLAALSRRDVRIPGATADRILSEARRLSALVAASVTDAGAPDAGAPDTGALDTGAMAALAYPDRIGLRRQGPSPDARTETARYALSGGKGAVIATSDPLSRARLLVATDLDGDPREARIRQGAPLDEADVRRLFGDRIRRIEAVDWSRREGRVTARRQERLGALILTDGPLPDPDPAAVAAAALDGLRDLGFSHSESARRLQSRIALLRRDGSELPDCSDEALLADADALLPFLSGIRTADRLRALDTVPVLRARLGHAGQRLLDRLAPAHFTTPLGREVAVDYSGGAPAIEVRLQEMFGVTEHPTVGPRHTPLRITLLSPAQRPVQVTTDLPGFWATSYADVRKDMRGQYPKHPWPEDPTAAAPTLRAKPRGT